MLTAGTALLLLLAVDATETVELNASIADVHGERFRLSGIRSRLVAAAGALAGEVAIDRLEILPSGSVVTNIDLSCGRIRLSNLAYYCDDASLTATLPEAGRQSARGSIVYTKAAGTAGFSFPALTIAGGRMQLSGRVGPAGYDIRFDGTGLRVEDVIELAAPFNAVIADFSGTGLMSARGRLGSAGAGETVLTLHSVLDGVSFANQLGTIAAADLRGSVDLDLTMPDEAARFSLQLNAEAGEAYLEPVYASFADLPLSLLAGDVTTTDFATFVVPRFRLRQVPLLEVSGDATLTMPADESESASFSGNLEFTDASVDTLYTSLVKVALAGTIFGDLETAGHLSGRMRIDANVPIAATLRLQDVILDDTRDRFAVYGLDGLIDWPGSAGAAAEPSRLRWDSASAYRVLVGNAELDLQLGPAAVELLTPLRLEMLGGALRINQLALENFGTDAAAGVLDAELEPVQLGQLTAAIGWPAFSGQLSGRLPFLRLSEGTMTVGGSLTARAFDGDIEVANLRVEQPFGRVPRLDADIRLRNLDLERITNVFAFGAIQGRLNGDVTGLQMIGWRTAALDMHFYTPPDDRSVHRISQRAVENLASVGGGGATAALSSGLLRFFEVFSYDRIGLRCVLRDGSCAMSGVGPVDSRNAAGGYYIVKGKGIPRIDVVGHRDKVSWSRLVRQFEDITRRTPTVVE